MGEATAAAGLGYLFGQENLLEAIDSGKLQVVIQELYDREIERGTIQVSGGNYISFTPKID